MLTLLHFSGNDVGDKMYDGTHPLLQIFFFYFVSHNSRDLILQRALHK